MTWIISFTIGVLLDFSNDLFNRQQLSYIFEGVLYLLDCYWLYFFFSNWWLYCCIVLAIESQWLSIGGRLMSACKPHGSWIYTIRYRNATNLKIVSWWLVYFQVIDVTKSGTGLFQTTLVPNIQFDLGTQHAWACHYRFYKYHINRCSPVLSVGPALYLAGSPSWATSSYLIL